MYGDYKCILYHKKLQRRGLLVNCKLEVKEHSTAIEAYCNKAL